MDPASLYAQIGEHIAAMPELQTVPVTQEAMQWLGRAHALAIASGDVADAMEIKSATRDLFNYEMLQVSGARPADIITATMFRLLANAELKAPTALQGAFIPVGNPHDAFVSISRAFAEAKKEILIVDCYMNGQALEYAKAAPESPRIKLLAGRKKHKPGLQPAIDSWRQQFKTNRPVELKLVDDLQLHDRLLIIDRDRVWSVTQSLNSIATRSPASILRVPPEVAVEKVASYEAIWSSA